MIRPLTHSSSNGCTGPLKISECSLSLFRGHLRFSVSGHRGKNKCWSWSTQWDCNAMRWLISTLLHLSTHAIYHLPLALHLKHLLALSSVFLFLFFFSLLSIISQQVNRLLSRHAPSSAQQVFGAFSLYPGQSRQSHRFTCKWFRLVVEVSVHWYYSG